MSIGHMRKKPGGMGRPKPKHPRAFSLKHSKGQCARRGQKKGKRR